MLKNPGDCHTNFPSCLKITKNTSDFYRRRTSPATANPLKVTTTVVVDSILFPMRANKDPNLHWNKIGALFPQKNHLYQQRKIQFSSILRKCNITSLPNEGPRVLPVEDRSNQQQRRTTTLLLRHCKIVKFFEKKSKESPQ